MSPRSLVTETTQPQSATRSGWRLIVEQPASVLGKTLRNLALQDLAALGLHLVLIAQALCRAHGPDASSVQLRLMCSLLATLVMLCLTRGELIPSRPLRALLYRAGMLGSLTGSYFVLRALLPALQPTLLDAKLISIDTTLFGKTPSAWLDPFVSYATVEWFAFFYFSYYALIASYIVGTLLLDDGPRRYELLLATALVVSVGHSVYTLVPGVGPYAWSQLRFAHRLVGGPWWNRVNAAVTSSGALLDIFPSLHTGLSTLMGFHAFRHRDRWPFRWLWIPTWFAVSNIVIATVFLRWHYGIDLVAGSLLSFGSQRVAVLGWRRESVRAEHGKQPVWETVFPGDMNTHDRRWIVGIGVIQCASMLWLLVICAHTLAP